MSGMLGRIPAALLCGGMCLGRRVISLLHADISGRAGILQRGVALFGGTGFGFMALPLLAM